MSKDQVADFVPYLLATIRKKVDRAVFMEATDELWQIRRQLAVLPTTIRLNLDQKIEVEMWTNRIKAALAKHMDREA